MKQSLLLGCLLALLALLPARAQTTTFDMTTKWDTARVLENPDKGWYHHYYIGQLDKYPVKQDSDLDNFPGLHHIYIRMPWTLFEPQQDAYNWQLIDTLMAHWVPKGYKFVIQITCYDPWTPYTNSTPLWVKNLGAQGTDVNVEYAPVNPYWEPNFNDPVFLYHLNDFHRAMAQRYNNNPNILYMHMGSLGSWGEGHGTFGTNTHWPLEVIEKHVDIYKNNYTLPIVMSDDILNYNLSGADLAALRTYVEVRNISYRDDSILVGWYVQQGNCSVASPEFFAETYRDRMTLIEIQQYNHVRWNGNWIGQDGSVRGAEILRCALRQIHPTYVGYDWFADEWLAENPNLAKQLANEIGYWYFINSATLPNQANPGTTQTISINWKNKGVAPAYNPYQIEFKFYGSNVVRTVTLPNSSNKDWLDGESETENYSVPIPADLGNGTFYVKVKLKDPVSGRDVDLGLRSTIKDADGFFSLGPITIGTGGNPIPTPAAPTALTTSTNTISTMALAWTDNAPGEDGFVVERKPEGGTYAEVASLPANTTTFTDTNLDESVLYTYRVAAYNIVGYSAYSNESTRRTYSVGNNLVINPGFEQDGSYTQTPAGWTATGDADAEYIEAGGHTGSLRGVHYSASSYNATTSQTITNLPNGNYVLRAYVQRSGDQTTARMQASGFGGATLSADIPKTALWTRLTIENIIVTNGQCTISFTSSGPAYKYTFYDDVELARVLPEPLPVPAAPANLVAQALSASEVKLTWTDNADNENGFKIERKSGSGAFTQVALVGFNTTQYTDNNLSANTSYTYRVRAYHNSGASVSGESTANTPQEVANIISNGGFEYNSSYTNYPYDWTSWEPTDADHPSDSLKVNDGQARSGRNHLSHFNTVPYEVYNSKTKTGVANGLYSLTAWVKSSGGQTTARMYVNNYGGPDLERQITASATWTRITIDNIAISNGGYTLGFHSKAAGGQWLRIDDVSLTLVVVPAVPSNLAVSPLSAGSVTLNWTDNDSNEQGFRIERKEGGGAFTEIAVAGADAGTYVNSGLTAGTAYTYRVRAYNGAGNSGYSNEASPTVVANVPAAPTGLAASAASTSQVNLTWTDNAANEAGFRIERRTGTGVFAEIATVPADLTSYSNTGLTPETPYTYRIAAYNASGSSAYSAEVSATTPALQLGANVLVNGGYEWNRSYTDYIYDWASWEPVTWANNSAADSLIFNRSPRGGTNHLRHFHGTAYELYTYQRHNSGLANGTYVLSAWVKSSGGQQTAHMYVNNYGGSTLSVSIPQASEWTKITIPSIAVTAGKYEVGFYSNASAGQWMEMDDVELKPVLTGNGGRLSAAEETDFRPQVFPVPSRGRITISLADNKHGCALKITNSLGMTVYSTPTVADGTEIDASHLADGLYLFTFTDGTRTVTRKAVIRR